MHRKAPNSLTGKRKVRKTRVRPDATAGTFAPPVTHFQASFWALIKEERTGERKDCADFWYIPAMAPDLTLVLLTYNICWPAFLHACCALQCAHKATPFPSIQSLSMPHIGRMPRWMPRITKLNKARLGSRLCRSEVACPLTAHILYPLCDYTQAAEYAKVATNEDNPTLFVSVCSSHTLMNITIALKVVWISYVKFVFHQNWRCDYITTSDKIILFNIG